MSIARAAIACLGAGRMGRGIAVAFAYAGYPVIMVDVKARAAEQFVSLQAEALGEISKTLASMARFGLLTDRDAKTVISRVSMVPRANMAAALANSEIVFEAVPEVVDLKREVLAAASVISRNMRDGRIGLRTGAGFLDYSGMDVDAYREQRLAELVNLLRHFGLARPPVLDDD